MKVQISGHVEDLPPKSHPDVVRFIMLCQFGVADGSHLTASSGQIHTGVPQPNPVHQRVTRFEGCLVAWVACKEEKKPEERKRMKWQFIYP